MNSIPYDFSTILACWQIIKNKCYTFLKSFPNNNFKCLEKEGKNECKEANLAGQWSCDKWENLRHWVANNFFNSPHWDSVTTIFSCFVPFQSLNGETLSSFPFPALNYRQNFTNIQHLNNLYRNWLKIFSVRLNFITSFHKSVNFTCFVNLSRFF